MVARCRTPEQTAFLTGLIPEYYRHAEAKKLKDFWTTVTEDWFKRYPLEDPPAALVEKLGSQERAVGAFRGTRIKVSQTHDRLRRTRSHLSSSKSSGSLQTKETLG